MLLLYMVNMDDEKKRTENGKKCTKGEKSNEIKYHHKFPNGSLWVKVCGGDIN